MVKLNSGKWVKSDEVKTGDKFKFINEGEWRESTKYKYDDGTPKKQFVMKVSVNGKGEYQFTINQTNKAMGIKEWGDDTKDWVDKEVAIKVVDVLAGGNMKKSIMFNLTPADATPPSSFTGEQETWDES